MKKLDLKDKVFFKLTVLNEYVGKKRSHWVCKCECGNETVVNATALKSGHVKSCGCLKGGKVTHGCTIGGKVSSEFIVWANVIDRCTNENNPAFHNYGGRGIGICKEWRNSFECFFVDMGNRPSAKHSLERINNDGNYSKTNCEWATRAVQSRNTRRNILFEYKGQKKCLAEWAEVVPIKYATLYRRLVKMKLPTEKAFALPVHYTLSTSTK